ncbi:MAG TPA: AAA family ATPase [Desulfobacterales bacterium]
MAVITISRQFGAGGITLGKLVAERLGYSFFDDEIIQMVAEKAKVSTRWAESMEKEAGGKIQRFISGMVSRRFLERLLDEDRGYIDEKIYVDLLHQIIRKIADGDNAVILGRGGQYILKDRADTFHFLLVAEKEHRIQFMETRHGLELKKAIHTVTAEDRRRTNLYRKFGLQDYDSAGHYHLVFNMRRTPVEKAADLICKMVSL